MKYKYCLLALLWPVTTCFSQFPLSIRPLKIGDTVPDVEINLLHGPVLKSNLSSYKGQLIILDFWATWCTSCLHGFPKLDSLQRKFKNQLQVLLVNTKSTGDDKKKAEAFFNKRGKQFSLPSVLEDTVLDNLFVHTMLPHYVWIKDGKVKAVTGSGEVTAENITAVLNNLPVTLRMKNDKMDYDRHKPLFVGGNNILSGSVLTGYTEGLPSGSVMDRDDKGLVSRLCISNTSLLQMFRQVYKATLFPADHMIIYVREPWRLSPPGERDNWKYSNTYCYEIKVPPVSQDSIYKLARQDLLRFFPYRVWRRQDTLVITDR